MKNESGLTFKYKIFRGSGNMSWDMLFDKAAAFAREIGPERVVSVSHSADGQSGTAVVWYWAEAAVK